MKNLPIKKFIVPSLAGLLIIVLSVAGYLFYRTTLLQKDLKTAQQKTLNTDTERAKILKQLRDLEAQDQVQINKKNTEEIQNIQKTYQEAVKSYEELLKLKELSKNTTKQDEQFADILNLLSEKNYASASAGITKLNTDITTERTKLAASSAVPANAVVNNTAPGSGYQRQIVETSQGKYSVDIIAADLNSTKVIVDTASDGTCGNDCPVASLGTFASRSGAYAGINGPYFCPASYPSCEGKKNSFDTLLMNKNKVYFNSDNNVHSVVPAVIFSGNSARFVTQSLQWGRDTGVDSVIASQPLLVLNGESTFGGDDEAKRSSKGPRAFIGASGSTAYIGVVHNASAAEAATVIKTMGVQNALNLDSGGSTALWSNGRYLIGPGRDTPFGILFVRK